MPASPNIQTLRRPRAHAGSCNSCQTDSSDTVIECSLKTLSFRVWSTTLMKLKEELKLVSELQGTLIPQMR